MPSSRLGADVRAPAPLLDTLSLRQTPVFCRFGLHLTNSFTSRFKSLRPLPSLRQRVIELWTCTILADPSKVDVFYKLFRSPPVAKEILGRHRRLSGSL